MQRLLFLIYSSTAALVAASALGSDQNLFASWESSNNADTKWYIQVKPPLSGIGPLPWGVERYSVFNGWTPRNKGQLENGTRPIRFLPNDNDTQASSTNYGRPPDGFDSFGSPFVWASATPYSPQNNSSDTIWLPASSNGFYLGPAANFTTSRLLKSSGNDNIQNTTWSSVPFGLSLGGPRSNGSVVFGGSYDWSRVNDTSWHKLPQDLAECLLYAGGENKKPCKIDSSLSKVGNPPANISQQISLDWSGGQLLLPPLTGPESDKGGGADCHGTIDITMVGIDINVDPSKLDTVPEDYACLNEEAGSPTSAGEIRLGTPFFQQLYMYAHQDGSVYIARALASNGTVTLRPFDPNATIEQHPGAKYAASPKSSAAPNPRDQLSILVSIPSFLAVFLLWQFL